MCPFPDFDSKAGISWDSPSIPSPQRQGSDVPPRFWEPGASPVQGRIFSDSRVAVSWLKGSHWKWHGFFGSSKYIEHDRTEQYIFVIYFYMVYHYLSYVSIACYKDHLVSWLIVLRSEQILPQLEMTPLARFPTGELGRWPVCFFKHANLWSLLLRNNLVCRISEITKCISNFATYHENNASRFTVSRCFMHVEHIWTLCSMHVLNPRLSL